MTEKIQSFHWQEIALRYPVELVTMLSAWELQSIYFLYQNQMVSKLRMQHPPSACKWAGNVNSSQTLNCKNINSMQIEANKMSSEKKK